jgi:RimJ/RimL family protein N-acetyltransferase
MLFPHTESRRISMRPATAKDAPKIYDILFRSGRAGLPLLDTFVETFGRGLAACFVVTGRESDRVIGFTTLSELAPPAGHVRVEVNMALGQPAELHAEAVALTTNFAFAMWRLRKVYLHSTDPSLASLGFGPEHAAMIRNEAVFSDHVYQRGRTWDVSVFAIYREQWDTHGVDFLKQIL